MKEGYWINYEANKVFLIDEHERWIRRWINADKLGIPPEVYRVFHSFVPSKDRNEFLLFVMKNAPVMRVRGHGVSITFEFSSKNVQKPLESIWEFAKQNAGELSALFIVNFALNQKLKILFGQFDRFMSEAGTEKSSKDCPVSLCWEAIHVQVC